MASVTTRPTNPSAPAAPALAVPLERGLVRTDLVLESVFAELRRRPAALLRVLGWSVRGRGHLARRLVSAGAFDAGALPYDEAVLAQARAAREEGRRVVLVARSTDRALAAVVAEQAGLFDAVYAPDSATGEGTVQVRARFERDERGAQAANTPGPSVLATTRAAVKALRPHQWVKNVLVFVPALLAHAFVRRVASEALWAFVAFSLCASSVYVVNDLLDLHADRAHERKRKRPFASGEVPLGVGLVMAPVLLAVSFALALLLSPAFAGVLGAYYAATVSYSFVLKRLALVDVLVLASLYTARMIAGSVAYRVAVSQWLLAFSLFFFLSLAFVKRYSEVHAMRTKGVEQAKGRGYRAVDLELLSSLGASAGYMSVLVLALYIQSADVSRLYAHADRLWALLPFLLYWISRVWLLAHRGQMHDDPIVFALRDKVSYVVAAIVMGVVGLAIGAHFTFGG